MLEAWKEERKDINVQTPTPRFQGKFSGKGADLWIPLGILI